MSDDRQPQTAQQAAEGMTDAVRELSKRLDHATMYGRRNRVMIWFTIVSLVIDIALTVAVFAVAVKAEHASGDAAKASASSTALCVAGNTARHQQRDIWTYFLHLLGKPSTPAGVHAEALLTGRLDKDFAPRNCTQLGRH